MPDQVETLIEKLKTTDRGVIQASLIEQLGSLRDHRAMKPIIDMLNAEEAIVRWHAIKALAGFGDDAGRVLLKMLETDDRYMRRNIVQALGEIGGEEVTDQLIRMLMFDESDKNVLIEVIRALHRIAPARAVEPLITVLKSKEWEMKWRAIHTLGRIGDPRAIEPLLEMMNDVDPDIRWAASVAVDNIKNLEINKGLDPGVAENAAPSLKERPARPAPRKQRELALTTSAPIGEIVIHIDGELTADSSKIFSGFVQGVISTSTDPIRLDMTKCDFVDSFALSTLNNLRKKLKAKKRSLKLSGLNPNILSVFKATRLDTLFEIV